MRLTDKQIAFLMDIAKAIPKIIGKIEEGNVSSSVFLGTRRLKNGTVVELTLVAENAKNRGDNGGYPPSPYKKPPKS